MFYNFTIDLFLVSRKVSEIGRLFSQSSDRWRCKWSNRAVYSYFTVPRHQSYEQSVAVLKLMGLKAFVDPCIYNDHKQTKLIQNTIGY